MSLLAAVFERLLWFLLDHVVMAHVAGTSCPYSTVLNTVRIEATVRDSVAAGDRMTSHIRIQWNARPFRDEGSF